MRNTKIKSTEKQSWKNHHLSRSYREKRLLSWYVKVFIIQNKYREISKEISYQLEKNIKMSFNFDQFNKTSLVSQNTKVRATEETQIVQSGYVKIPKNDGEIFQKNKMNISLPAAITFLDVANDWLIILMSNQLLFRINLKQPDNQSEVFLEKFITGQRVSGMFLDPTGTHLLLTLAPKSSGYSYEIMYLNKNSNKPKIVSKVSFRL